MGNKLALNIVKTHSMIISTRQKERGLTGEFDLNLQNTPILKVGDTKYLGIQIDKHLTWKKHVDAVIRNFSRAIGLLKHVKNFLPHHLLEYPYVSIVEPHLRYCSSVWGCCSGTELDKRQKLQIQDVRITTNSPFDSPSKPLLSNLGLESIREFIDYEVAAVTYKSLNNLAPLYLRNLFTRNSHCLSRALRNTQSDLKLPLKKTSSGQNGFSFRGMNAWNGISAAAKKAPSVKSFKVAI